MEKEFTQSYHRSITDTPSAIDARDFNLWYGDFQALKHISLDIPEHRCTAFIGPSGCGKSTLLRTFNRMMRLTHAQADEVLERTLSEAALWDEVKDKLDQSGLGLSGGQQQRLCIARALATSPDVLLMDEPTSALDPISTLVVEELMQQLSREHTVVVVTHNMQQATRVADKTAFFYLGELIEAGPTKELFANPREQRTQEYLSGRFS